MEGDANLIVECDDGFVATTLAAVLTMEWFRAMMTSGLQESRERVVRLAGYRKAAVTKLLQLKKGEEGKMTLDDAALVLPLAHYLAEKRIVEEAKAMVSADVQVTNGTFASLFALAVQMEMEVLRTNCQDFWILKGKCLTMLDAFVLLRSGDSLAGQSMDVISTHASSDCNSDPLVLQSNLYSSLCQECFDRRIDASTHRRTRSNITRVWLTNSPNATTISWCISLEGRRCGPTQRSALNNMERCPRRGKNAHPCVF